MKSCKEMWVISMMMLLTLSIAALHAQAPADKTPPNKIKLDGPPTAPKSEPPATTTTTTTPTTTTNAPATITVQVPPNASIWIGEQQMKQSGPRRSFQSPPLDPGKTYAYKFKVSWPGAAGQKDVVTEQEVTVRAGQNTIIDFTPLTKAPPTTTTFTQPNMPSSPTTQTPPPRTNPIRRTGGGN